MKSFCGNCLLTTFFIALMATLMTIIFWSFVTDRPYNLVKIRNHTIERQTLSLGLRYYVKENFIEIFGRRLDAIETEIESQFVKGLFEMCLKELHNKKRVIMGAIAFGDEELERRARLLKLTSCPEQLLFN